MKFIIEDIVEIDSVNTKGIIKKYASFIIDAYYVKIIESNDEEVKKDKVYLLGGDRLKKIGVTNARDNSIPYLRNFCHRNY